MRERDWFLAEGMNSVENLIMDLTDISPLQKKILKIRYCSVVIQFNRRVWKINILFNCMRFVVTVGSLVVPALLSIQTPGSKSDWISTETIYWCTWAISLAVTMSNGILALFRIDKKYYSLNTVLEHLRSEGWQYLELTGRYSGHFGDHQTKPTHKTQFVYFCNMVEKIIMKQVEDEYYKVNDSLNSTTPNSNQTVSVNSSIVNGGESKMTLSGSSIHPPSPSDLIAMPTPGVITFQSPNNSPLRVEQPMITRRESINTDKNTVRTFDSSTHNREDKWGQTLLSDAELEEKTTSNVKNQQGKGSSSVPSMQLTISQVQPLEMSPSLTQKNGQTTQPSEDHIIVIPTQ